MEKVTAFLKDTAQFSSGSQGGTSESYISHEAGNCGLHNCGPESTVILATYLGFSDWALARIVKMLWKSVSLF